MSTSSYDGHSSLEPSSSYEGGRSLAGISEKKMKIEINYEKLFTVNINISKCTCDIIDNELSTYGCHRN